MGTNGTFKVKGILIVGHIFVWCSSLVSRVQLAGYSSRHSIKGPFSGGSIGSQDHQLLIGATGSTVVLKEAGSTVVLKEAVLEIGVNHYHGF